MQSVCPDVESSTFRHLFVGSFSFTDTNFGGIGYYRYRETGGELTYLTTFREDIKAGVLCVDRSGRRLYAVDERKDNPDHGGKGGGRVYAFSVDEESGTITEINHRDSLGSMPCFLTLDGTGRYLLVSHFSDTTCISRVLREPSGKLRMELQYSDSVITLFPLDENGAIGEPCDALLFPPEDGVPACLHSVVRAPTGNLFAVCSRNHSQVHMVKLDYDRSRLSLTDTLSYPKSTAPRSGYSPRYCVFHPHLPILYVNNEFLPHLLVLRYTEEGRLESVWDQDATPQLDKVEGQAISMSDLCIDPTGNTLYALYRQINAVCIFRLDPLSGKPSMLQSLKLEGKGPRGVTVSPDGRFLVIANQASEDLEVRMIGKEGTAEQVGRKIIGQKYPADPVFL